MELTFKRNVQVVGVLLLLAVITQAIYTGLYVSEMAVPRKLLWGSEGVLFVLLAAFAGSAMVQTREFTLVFTAIAFAAVLNVVQVGVGHTMFMPFREAANATEAFAPAAGAVVSYSFFVYNGAKMLLGLAALALGLARMGEGGKLLGGLTALVGGIALVANAASMAIGRDASGELPIAGGSGVLATLLLAVCLFGLREEKRA